MVAESVHSRVAQRTLDNLGGFFQIAGLREPSGFAHQILQGVVHLNFSVLGKGIWKTSGFVAASPNAPPQRGLHGRAGVQCAQDFE